MQFGKYRLIRKLATGGMAEIFLASNDGIEGFRKDIVIKRILPVHADNAELIDMFLDEARIAATLNHPNIAHIFDLGKADGEFFIAMEYIHGQDLRRVCERGLAVGNFVPLRHAVRVIADTAGGLQYAHNQVDTNGKRLNIVHRDISPQNIVVSFDGVVKILDFGIAKAANKIVTTRHGQLKGKYAYMSPEQCNGLEVDHRSDIFSLGTLLYEITVCTRLFKGETDIQTIKNVSEAQVPTPTSVRPEYPMDLEVIVLKALAKDPHDRYQSGRELQEDLEDFLRNNRMKTGPVQLGNYMREIFPDKLDLPEEDPDLTDSPPQKEDPPAPSAPQQEVADDLTQATEPTPTPTPAPAPAPAGPESVEATQVDFSPALPEPEAPAGELHVDIPSGTPPSAEEIKRWTEDIDVQRPVTQPQAVTEPMPEQVSFVVNKAAPYKVSKEEEAYKPKKQTRKVSRSSVKTVEYQLRSSDEDELDSYEKGSRVYYLILGVLVFGMLGFASHQLYKSGLFFASSDFAVEANDPLNEIEAEPPPPALPTVLQHVTSIPPGASVAVNGILQEGETPGDFAVLPGKINSINLYLLGHRPGHRNIDVPKDKGAEPLQLNLETIETDKLNEEEDFGQLQVRSDPSGATVILNGKSAGQTPLMLNKLVAGLEYHILLRREEYHDHVIIQHLYPNITNDLGVHKLVSKERKAAERFTEFNFETKNATIVLDNAVIGPSPYFKPMGKNQAVRIELKAEDRLPYRRVFETKVGSVSFAPDLKKIDRTPGKLTLKVSPKQTKVFLGPNEYDYNEIKKVELPPGDIVVTLVTPDNNRSEVKLNIKPGESSTFSIDFTGKNPVVSPR